jgi:hypothetical protein
MARASYLFCGENLGEARLREHVFMVGRRGDAVLMLLRVPVLEGLFVGFIVGGYGNDRGN